MDLGLDFGTTFTVVAHADRGNYPVVGFFDADGDAHDHFPSVVADDGGTLAYGFSALEAARRGAPVLRSFKRSLSQPSLSPHTTVAIGHRAVTVLELMTGFFTALREALHSESTVSGFPVTQARTVLGVPAQAHSAQRFVTLEACRLAGFDVIGMVNEPSAASFEFAHRQARSVTSRRNLVIVYDFGGGTFDVSLVLLDGKRHEVLDSFGVNRLGGDDVDEALALLTLSSAGGSRADLSDAEWQSLLAECREAKEKISPQTRRVVVEAPSRASARPELRTVDIGDLYAAVTPLVEATISAMEPLVAALPARQGADDADADALAGVAGIYLVGGASALPLVPRVLRARFGRRVHRAPLPGASTAVGLAIAADKAAGFSLTDRLSRGFGVFREQEGGAAVSFDPLLDRSLVTVDTSAGGSQGAEVVVTRRYRAAHNIGWFRFVEYASVDQEGVPRGDLVPRGEIVFPFDAALQHDAQPQHGSADTGTAAESSSPRSGLRAIPVVRRGDGPLSDGPLIEERYSVGADGIIAVAIEDLTTGYRQEAVLRP